jgi:hypothetical protein
LETLDLKQASATAVFRIQQKVLTAWTRFKPEKEDYLDVSGRSSDHGVQLSLESAHDRRVLQKLTESEPIVGVRNLQQPSFLAQP